MNHCPKSSSANIVTRLFLSLAPRRGTHRLGLKEMVRGHVGWRFIIGYFFHISIEDGTFFLVLHHPLLHQQQLFP